MRNNIYSVLVIILPIIFSILLYKKYSLYKEFILQTEFVESYHDVFIHKTKIDSQKQIQLKTEWEFLNLLRQSIEFAKANKNNVLTLKKKRQYFIDVSGSNIISDSSSSYKHTSIIGTKDTFASIVLNKSNRNFSNYKTSFTQSLSHFDFKLIKNNLIIDLINQFKASRSFTEVIQLDKNVTDAFAIVNTERANYKKYLEYKMLFLITIFIVLIIGIYIAIFYIFNFLQNSTFNEVQERVTGTLGTISNTIQENNKFNFKNNNSSTSEIINTSNIIQSNSVLIKDFPFQINNLLNTLERFSSLHRNFGTLLTFILITIIFIFGYFVNFKFIPDQAKIIAELTSQNKSTFSLVAYYLGRVLLFGSFSSAVIYFIYRVIKSSFDQSVRYRKKQHGLIIFQKLINRYPEATLKELNEIVNVYDHITKSVDSAFTESELKNSKDKTTQSVKFKDGDKEFSTNTV